MDECELNQDLQKHSAAENPRSPFGSVERNNGTTTRWSRTREVSSRYRSPTPSAISGPRRCPTPNTRTATTSSVSVPKRAISVERRRPATPPSPPSPSTPVHDTTAVIQMASRKLASTKPEALWPTTRRSLSVSFQSDTFSLPISKREKTVTHAQSDRTLRPSLNAARKKAETPPDSRKATPERKRSPLKGKNAPDQLENSRPLDQHRWPSRIGGRVSSNSLAKIIDLADKTTKASTMAVPSSRRMSLPGSFSKPLQEFEACSVDDNTLRKQNVFPSRSSERTNLVTPASRTQSLPTPGMHPSSRPASPNKAALLSASVSRGASPSQTRTLSSAPSRGASPSQSRPSSPSRTRTFSSAPSRGVSPSQTRPSSPSRQANSSTSVLSYMVDIRKGNKVANHIEDVHQLRLMYNRHLQWQYANAQADVALNSQKEIQEKALYNVRRSTLELWDSVTEKRIDLQQLKLKLKLYSVLNNQVAYLDEWPLIEKDHTCALSGAINDLEASTLRLPVNGGAKADIDTVKAAISSAVDVMQKMGSSICSILSRVEGMNSLVSELSDVAAQERAMLDECETQLTTTAAMQIEEYSLRTNLIQLKQS